MRIDGWIAKRLGDPAAIKACATGTVRVDENLAWRIERTLEKTRLPSPAFKKAWRLIVKEARERHNPLVHDWPRTRLLIESGDISTEVFETIADFVRPRLRLTRPWGISAEEGACEQSPNRLADLLSIDMQPIDWPTSKEILDVWPDEIGAEKDEALLSVLSHTLNRSLEDAKFGELITPELDAIEDSVNSVSRHNIDRYSSGFYRIVRITADIWARLARKDPTSARTLVEVWKRSSFLLVRRLALYALSNSIFTGREAAKELLSVSDDEFYYSGARRETMKLMADRWVDFPTELRDKIEARVTDGPPESMLSHTSEMENVVDWQRFIRLSRIVDAGGQLSEAALSALDAIRARHPEWVAGPNDQDDFRTWHESRQGLSGEASLLNGVAPERLIDKAFEIQSKKPIEQGDLWRVFCGVDTARALAALKADAEVGRWREKAWRGFFWELQAPYLKEGSQDIAELLMEAPDDLYRKLDGLFAGWLQKARIVMVNQEQGLWAVWDRLVESALTEEMDEAESGSADDDILNDALNSAAGRLAEILIDELFAREPKAGSGISEDLKRRFDRLATAESRVGLLARAVFASRLSNIFAVDPKWAKSRLIPRFRWNCPDAAAMWSARAYDSFGSVSLFSELKEPFLELFDKRRTKRKTDHNMAERLAVAAISHHDSGPTVDLDPKEVRATLRHADSSTRSTVAWTLWRALHNKPSADRAEEWRNVVGPTFKEIWPLDRDLQDKKTSHSLVQLAFAAGEAFPEAVDAVLPFVVPHESYLIAGEWTHNEDRSQLVRKYPREVLSLLSAVIGDPPQMALSDFASAIEHLRAADPGIVATPAFRRIARTAKG